MCGIAGGWEPDDSPGLMSRLRAALTGMKHRGPDDMGETAWRVDSGITALGSTRLAVQDLSSAGHMPMESGDGRFVIVFNGELSNFVEIRKELRGLGRTFSSTGDTEVLLQSWAEWGIGAVDRFEGMFAFAVLDRAAATLTLVRDVFGVKPLCYARGGVGELYFASDLPGLLSLLPGQAKLNWQTGFDYVRWGSYDGQPETFVDGVLNLMPGHSITLDLRTGILSDPQKYWIPSVAADRSVSFADATERVREIFLESVRRNLRSDVPVGVALSGGIDSSAIVSSIRHLEPDYELRTFSFIAPGFEQSEDDWINLVASEMGAISHTVAPAATDLRDDLDDMIRTQGEPFGSTSIYAQYRVFRLAREHGVTVTLDGQGADELFAGYSGYPAQRLRTLVESGRFMAARTFLREWQAWPGRPPASTVVDTALSEMMPLSVARRLERMRAVESPLIDYGRLADRGVHLRVPRPENRGVRGRRLSSSLREALTVRGVSSLLRHGDRNSMRFSVESRVPFLDRRLVEFTLGLPESYLLDDRGTTKSVLRAAMRGIVPDAVLDRRDKIGFATPESGWLDDLIRMRSGASASGVVGFLRLGSAERELLASDTEESLRLEGGARWRILNLTRWAQLFGIDAS